MNAALMGGGFAFLSPLDPRFKQKVFYGSDSSLFGINGPQNGDAEIPVDLKVNILRVINDFFFTRAANATTTQTFLHLGTRSTTQVKIKKESERLTWYIMIYMNIFLPADDFYCFTCSAALLCSDST